MRVVVTRTGGLAGIRRSWSVDIDAQPDAGSWVAQLDALPWPTAAPRATGADRFVYRLAVEDVSGARSVTLGEADLGDAWRALVDRVRAAS